MRNFGEGARKEYLPSVSPQFACLIRRHISPFLQGHPVTRLLIRFFDQSESHSVSSTNVFSLLSLTASQQILMKKRVFVSLKSFRKS